MKIYCRWIGRSFLLMVVCLLILTEINAQQPAFPGAEGFGKYATGGRGGRVIEVTTLEDVDRYGIIAPGSFREALNTEGDEPLTVVFRVSGIIELRNELKSGRSNLTIAGQTAPGDGICFKNSTVKLSGSNLIIRYLRFRPGDEAGYQTTGLNIENASNFIVDHCSMSWGVEENATFYDNRYTTIQWCIISEGLYDSYHSKGARGYGGQWGGQYASYHHNLLAHNHSRSPRINGCRAHDTIALLDFRNNVVYNWRKAGAIYGGEVEIFWPSPDNPDSNRAGNFTNFVNNYYKPGPATENTWLFAAPSYVTEDNEAAGYGKWFFSGNYMEGDEAGINEDNWLGVDASRVGGIDSIRWPEEFAVEEVTTQTAGEAFEDVIAHAGAVLPRRDPVDERIVNEIRGINEVIGNGIIDSETEIGGWPVYGMPREEDVPADSDQDGMPDYWEELNGLDPDNGEDGRTITDDGYSNLEHYLNSDIPYIEPQELPVRNNTEASFLIHPNPAGEQIHILTDQPVEKFEMYTVSGNLVLTGRKLSQYPVIDLKGVIPGTYIVTVWFADGNLVSSHLIVQ